MTNSALWYALPTLTGEKVRLEPLAMDHAPGYLAAVGPREEAEEIFRWNNTPGGAPATLADAERHIAGALAARAASERFPYAQLDATTGEFIGTTSFYDVMPARCSLAIGHTWLGQRWWRTGHNTEAKLLLLRFAFDTLGAVRVVWHVDIHNTRSQAAVERLGAAREAVIRKHLMRRDGSWRDTVQFAMLDEDWAGVQERLAGRLAAG